MKLLNVSFAQRYFLSVAFISCLPALLSFTGSKFPCEFVSCCCLGDPCSALYLTVRFTWGSAATTTTKPGCRSSTPMWDSWFCRVMLLVFHTGCPENTRAQLRKCFVLSNEHQLSQFKAQSEAGCGDSDWNLPKCRLWDDSGMEQCLSPKVRT